LCLFIFLPLESAYSQPDSSSIYKSAAKAIKNNQFEAAQTQLNQLLTTKPYPPKAIYFLAVIFYKQGKFNKAIKYFRHIIKNEYSKQLIQENLSKRIMFVEQQINLGIKPNRLVVLSVKRLMQIYKKTGDQKSYENYREILSLFKGAKIAKKVIGKKLSYLSASFISWEETLDYTGVNSKYSFTGGCFGYGKLVRDWGYHFCFLLGTGTVEATSAFSETGQTAFGLEGDLYWN